MHWKSTLVQAILKVRMITNLQFADDIVGLASKAEEFASLVQYLDRISTTYSMEINVEKNQTNGK